MTAPAPQAGSPRPDPPRTEPDRPGDLRPDVAPPHLADPAEEVKAGRAPWSWATIDTDREARQASHIDGFVAWFNQRYAWTPDHLIPPCWARHGALIEEITTLMWSRWAAFQAPQATPDAAQTWHTYTLPMFMARLARWLPAASLTDCQAGRHQPSRLHTPTMAFRPAGTNRTQA